MSSLASILDYFNDVDDDEFLRLYEQAIAIFSRVEGSSSVNVAIGENNLASAYKIRANRAEDANDRDRCIANLELTLIHLREAARIFRANNHVEKADILLHEITKVEEIIAALAAGALAIAVVALAAAVTRR